MQERLELIYEKIQKLIAVNKQLKEENTFLINKVELSRNVQDRLKTDLEKVLVEKENIENKIYFGTLAAENLTKKEIKAKIDQYISEIDNCIEQIEKL
jgi:cell division septum initiation protein DivIVA